MKTYKVTYTPNKKDFFEAFVEAATYTYALLAFVIKYPGAYYTNIEEVSM